MIIYDTPNTKFIILGGFVSVYALYQGQGI